MKIAFLCFPEQKNLLLSELKNRFNIEQKPTQDFGDLLYFENLTKNDELYKTYWAKTIMIEPKKFEFQSISQAVNHLKNIQRNWASYQFTSFRRATLILEKLPYINTKPKKFPVKIPVSQIGLFTLIDQNSMIYSEKTTSNFPSGNIQFIEDHENPPSRAYLKIQESLTIANSLFNFDLPNESSLCFEAGACPGGWTWVFSNLGSKIIAVDRAELDQRLMKNPLVTFIKHDAFTLKPEELSKNQKIDFVFSDVICYPERLLEWIKMWLEFDSSIKMICTIKMQGEIDWKLIAQFEQIKNSHIFHLNYNKHELTWFYCGN